MFAQFSTRPPSVGLNQAPRYCTLILLFCFSAGVSLYAQKVTDPAQYDVSYEAKKLQSIGRVMATAPEGPMPGSKNQPASSRDLCEDGIIPRDGSYTLVPRNDDGSLGPIALGFTFSFCGASYSSVWINTNGNLTFTGPFGTFTPTGFPIGVPMVAAFWGDVDTRTCTGAAYYKLFADHLIVTWDAVGYYNLHCDKVNTFQIIISNGTAALPGPGSNIQFRYGDMQWTTGDASGGSGGFGGAPATVGYNAGDATNYEQVGRFDHAGTDYDGPFDANDGVSYLDGTCFIFNAAVDLDGDGVNTCFDCDDTNPDIYPGAPEVCNGEDDDCDGDIDEGFDTDGDGYTSCGGDCNDSNASINPGAEETCDGIDNNCNGATDEGFTNSDGDSLADCVDPDDDNDGCLDEDDPNPTTHSDDADCDGVHDDCDVCPTGDDSVDNNEDGIPDCSQLLNYSEYSSAWYCASNKISICHNGHTICVSKNALPAHYNHGDDIGPCTGCSQEFNIMAPNVVPETHNEGLLIYPNPASDNLTIHLEEHFTEGSLTIVDQLNRVIWKSTIAGEHEISLTLDHPSFTDGMYLIVLNVNERTLTKRFVIIK